MILRSALFVAVLSAGHITLGSEVAPNSAQPATPPLECKIGPAKRSFGGTPWLVYSCTDGASMVVVSDTGSPAMPFVFFLGKGPSGYSISGEGTGDKRLSDAAGDVLATMSPAEREALLAATMQSVR